LSKHPMFAFSWWFIGSFYTALLCLYRRLNGTVMSSPREPASAEENPRRSARTTLGCCWLMGTGCLPVEPMHSPPSAPTERY
ncbi:hypothetical protein XENOCAPTIV_021158, partial [Xenoophorus captivus]